MSDIRKWRFTAGYGATTVLANLNTSYWGEWGADGDPAVLTYTIHAQYELADQRIDAMERRGVFEKRLKVLASYVKRQGILEVDFSATGSRPETLTGVVLDSISPVQADNNLILEVDLKFVYTTPGTLLRSVSAFHLDPPPGPALNWDSSTRYQAGDVVNYLSVYYKAIDMSIGVAPQPTNPHWGPYSNANKGPWTPFFNYTAGDIVTYNDTTWKAKQPNIGQAPAVNAIWGINGSSIGGMDNTWFYITYDRPDRTLFKTVARGADIRVRSSPAMETVTLTGIRQKVAGGSELARRQASESMMLNWVRLKGEELSISIDGASQGVWHLSDVKQGKVDLMDAVTFDLVFFRGYVNG